MNGYWKFYRKMIEHPIFQDDTAFRIFIWILSTVKYETGKMAIKQIIAAELLGINPNTLRSALLRLQRKYHVISLNGTNKKTEISVLNWDKYQSEDSHNTNQTRTKHEPNTNAYIYKEAKKERSMHAASVSDISSKQLAWDKFSPPYLISLSITDRIFESSARKSYLENGKIASENAVKSFIDAQRKQTPPDQAEYMTDLWVEARRA